jgi:anti-sigma B factor antagonist
VKHSASGRRPGDGLQPGRCQANVTPAGGSPIAVLHRSPEFTAPPAPWGRAFCEVEPHRDAAHVLAIGELDIATAPIVDAQLDDLHRAGFRRLVLDLRRVTFMDVRGLRVVLEWAAGAERDGVGSFAVIPGPSQVQRIFALTGTAGSVSFVER